jgi:hypothetical protein
MRLILIATGLILGSSLSAKACDPRAARPAPRPGAAVPQPLPRPQPVPQPIPQPSAVSPPANAEVEPVWDLPEDKTKPSPKDNTSSATAGLSERLMQAGAVRQTLITQNAKLIAKRGEMLRWDDAAREKFERIFGTSDEAVRRRVLQRLEGEILQNQKLIVALTENMSMELYFQAKRK